MAQANPATTTNVKADANAATAVAIIDEGVLRGKIHEVRGQKVMLDFELAEIYGYTTKAFNQQVQRNVEKFDDDFRFHLTSDEWVNLRSQIVTSSWGGSRYRPYAFTEQGVYMLMTVLKGELATRQSKALIRLFKRLKDYALEGRDFVGAGDFHQLSDRVDSNSADIAELRDEVRRVGEGVAALAGGMADAVRRSGIDGVASAFAPESGYLIGAGQPVEGQLAYSEVYGQAASALFVVDNYIDMRTLVLLKAVQPGVEITVFSDNIGSMLHGVEFDAFRREYPGVDVRFVRTCGAVHDRYVVLDYGTQRERVFLCGGSSKDAGKRTTTILEAERPAIFRGFFDELLANPPLELP